MEQDLDDVEEGSRQWVEVIDEFYKDFEVHVKHADAEMEKVVIKDEPAGEDCEKCGSPMVYKLGRYGKFMACSNFPDCRNTKAIMKPIGVKCPSCETGEIVERKSKTKRLFYGCNQYPECEFVSWDKPISRPCPKCSALLVEKKTEKKVCKFNVQNVTTKKHLLNDRKMVRTMTEQVVNVIGAGLAGSEAAWQIAKRGVKVRLYEMRPVKQTPAHHTDKFAELVCSNSLRANTLTNAVGVIKEEMRLLDSVILKAADACSVPAGGALAVDRHEFAGYVTDAVKKSSACRSYSRRSDYYS